MNTILRTLVAAGIVASFSLNALASDPPNTQEQTQHMEPMKNLTPEQRAMAREARHKEMSSLTPEQREARRKEMRDRREKMSPDERKEMREKMNGQWKNMPSEDAVKP